MSIINDALKKTQMRFKRPKKDPVEQTAPSESDEPKEQNTQDLTNIYEKMYKDQKEKQDQREREASARTVTQTPRRPPSKDSAPLRPLKKWLKTYSTALIVICAVTFSLVLIIRSQPVQDFFRSTQINGRSSPGLSFARPAAKKRTYRDGELILNGTSFVGGKNIALINDEIYEIGDMVDGKRVTSIAPNKVELRDDTKIITIKVR